MVEICKASRRLLMQCKSQIKLLRTKKKELVVGNTFRTRNKTTGERAKKKAK
jgi:hypothetical protein